MYPQIYQSPNKAPAKREAQQPLFPESKPVEGTGKGPSRKCSAEAAEDDNM